MNNSVTLGIIESTGIETKPSARMKFVIFPGKAAGLSFLEIYAV